MNLTERCRFGEDRIVLIPKRAAIYVKRKLTPTWKNLNSVNRRRTVIDDTRNLRQRFTGLKPVAALNLVLATLADFLINLT
jgi:hypothetical protein